MTPPPPPKKNDNSVCMHDSLANRILTTVEWLVNKIDSPRLCSNQDQEMSQQQRQGSFEVKMPYQVHYP